MTTTHELLEVLAPYDYYKEQLKRLNVSGLDSIKIRLADNEGKGTNYLSLNKESIPYIQNLLNDILYLSDEKQEFSN